MQLKWIAAGALLRCVLLLYGSWQDQHFDVKYTDVDYDVFSDAAIFVSERKSPYDRPTYRYSPLISWLLLPNVFLTRLWGKVVFCLFDLLCGYLMDRWHEEEKHGERSKIAVVLWLFNPFTFTISTRGNCDSVTVFGLIALLMLLRKGRWGAAGMLWGMCVHWRLFPLIYAPAILFHLVHYSARQTRTSSKVGLYDLVKTALNRATIEFGLGALLSLGVLGVVFYAMYSDDYLEHALLYHLTRLDPRHNFSLHYYPIYLLHWNGEDIPLNPLAVFVKWLDVGRVSSAMQLSLILSAGFRYRTDLPLAFTLTTVIFVAFNKVSTAQYFVWYLGLLPLLIRSHRLETFKAFSSSYLIWVAALAHWLFWAYLLEFKGWSCHLLVWVASCLFLAAHVVLVKSILTNFA